MSIDEKILDLLDEEEIKLAISHMNINSLLNPMKHNQKMYSQQIKKLRGRIGRKFRGKMQEDCFGAFAPRNDDEI